MTDKRDTKYLHDWSVVKDAMMSNETHKALWYKMMEEDFEEISYNDSLELDESYKHATHCLLWCRNDAKLWDYNLNASCMMQMRFDGHIGFPGGFIDPSDKNFEAGLNRELQEELNLDKSFQLSRDNYFYSTIFKERKTVLHFYTKEYSPEDFHRIELESINSDDFGGEVMGIIRPPLFQTHRNRGFSTFITNRFIGNALIQFLKSLVLLKIFPLDQLEAAIKHA